MPIDYTRYPPNWKEIRARILERARNCCEGCGIENYAINARGAKVVLTIAHLDHDPENWDVTDERLKALCQACHLGYDRTRHVRKRKFGMDVYKQPKLKLL
jgi:5-methylcytosine-specific restriction endonuclease McrA